MPAENINTRAYWDGIYAQEWKMPWFREPDRFRSPWTRPELWPSVLHAVTPNHRIAEFGAGLGDLAQKLRQYRAPVDYVAYDISQESTKILRHYGFQAETLDARDTRSEHLAGISCVVATEFVEHLDRDVFDHWFRAITGSEVQIVVLTVPNNCMGPEEVPEHQALFTEELLRDYLQPYADSWTIKKIEPKADKYLVCVLWRRNG